MAISNAYWISPSGVASKVRTSHIQDVLTEPEHFNLSLEAVKAVFDRYGEPYGHEGKARRDVMESLLHKGWIRIRYVPQRDSYTVELNRLGKKEADYLWQWAGGLVASEPKRAFSDVHILSPLGAFDPVRLSLSDVARDFLYTMFDLSGSLRHHLTIFSSVSEAALFSLPPAGTRLGKPRPTSTS